MGHVIRLRDDCGSAMRRIKSKRARKQGWKTRERMDRARSKPRPPLTNFDLALQNVDCQFRDFWWKLPRQGYEWEVSSNIPGAAKT